MTGSTWSRVLPADAYTDYIVHATEEQEKEKLEAGRRIFVLTPQGETLQKYRRFDEPVHMMALVGRLLVSSAGIKGEPRAAASRALKGL